MPRASQEEIAKVHLGALAQAVLLDRAEYLDVLRDHGAAVAWDPAGAEFVSQYQDPERIFVQHNQDGLAAPVVSLPVQGTVVGGQRRRRASTDGTGRRRPYHNDHTPTGMERSRFSPALESESLDAPRGTVQDAGAPGGTVHRGEQRRQPGSGFHPGGFERFAHGRDSSEFPAPAAVSGSSAFRPREDRDADVAPSCRAARRVWCGPNRSSLHRSCIRPASDWHGLRRRFAMFQLILIHSRYRHGATKTTENDRCRGHSRATHRSGQRGDSASERGIE